MLIGCTSSPRERYYVLSANIDTQQAKNPTATYGIVIGTVTIPEVVDRPQIVVLKADSQVSVAEQSRWAEPLNSNISRVVADNLAHLLPGAQVSSVAQSRTVASDYRVMVEVQHFDSIVGEGVRDEFLWIVHTPNSDGVEKRGRTVVRETAEGGEYAALVAAHSRALTTLSRDIATAIQAIRQ
ncbi:conserved hypothetical protein [Ricinus communis]|uniref:ABC-type transport auxiliary lipoprotein component domain-containing protein n=1 Tax=Ricinus communis TaxID=3988 RepID=B9TIM5_RICCO|nr:conserved hypothetical protein [Ricinus communis]